MRVSAIRLGWVATALAVAACSDPLSVQNNNNPDVGRVLATPAGIEQLISTQFQATHAQTQGNNMRPQAAALGLESYGSVANFNMAVRAAIPRIVIQNDRGNATSAENFNDFRELQKIAKSSTNAILALDKLIDGGGSLGSKGRNLRARAFAFFTLGVALGEVALVYDSAAVIEPSMDPNVIPDLSAYPDVMSSALDMLDSALTITTSADAVANATDFAIPATWINGNAMDNAAFARVIHSYKARFRAGVARTPGDIASVDWQAVLDDATAGITSDLNITLTNSGGWAMGFLAQMYTYGGWSMAPPAYIGFADSSGAFDAWLAAPLSQRAGADGTQFLMIKTLDKRFPSGDTRAAQQTASGDLPTNGYPYFRNRADGDTRGDPWAQSQYDHYRFRYLTFKNSNRDGPWPTFTVAENDMLAAEAYLRLPSPNVAAAAALIDKTRTKAGLPALSGVITTVSDPVPGGVSCVPRVPAGPNFTSTTCGTILEAMKYEKRLETLYTGYAQWWVDSRRWGDLPEGTALQFPVPYQEMDARGHPFYNLGGVGGQSAAAKGTYGY